MGAFKAQRWRLSISAYLGLGLGGLVLVALALLLWLTLSTVFRNTTELMEDKSRIFLNALTTQTGRYLDSTLAPSKVVAEQIESGKLHPSSTADMEQLLRTLLATTPQIDVLAFIDINGTRVAAFRDQGNIQSNRQPWPENAEIGMAMSMAEAQAAPMWGAPIHNPELGTFLNLRRPVHKDSVFLGMVTALITIRTLSEFLGELETETEQTPFILYDRDYVLAHLDLTFPLEGLREDRPLLRVDEIGDPILANIWRDGWQDETLIAGTGHADADGDRAYVFLYAPLEDYADVTWLVGSYFPIDVIGIQFQRMIGTGIASVLLVALTVLGTYLLGRMLRKPINQLATAAMAVQRLDLDDVPHLAPSRFEELDEAGRAFNAMASALHAFSHYVPRDLVLRLMARGDVGRLGSQARNVTVLMTDIVGFTSLAERWTAEETALFLNHHLGLITRVVEAEGGIVDKYMGDAVMALWGAIDDEPAQAVRALVAARQIDKALRRDNEQTGERVRLRIGIHTGPVVVGNIGTATRMNYTVVGDTVNMAKRLEALAKTLLPEREIAVLASAATADAASGHVTMMSLGRHGLRGRAQDLEVFTLQETDI